MKIKYRRNENIKKTLNDGMEREKKSVFSIAEEREEFFFKFRSYYVGS